jgi:hypothetical protein
MSKTHSSESYSLLVFNPTPENPKIKQNQSTIKLKVESKINSIINKHKLS